MQSSSYINILTGWVVTLACYVRFEFMVHVENSKDVSEQAVSTMGKSFQTQARRQTSDISWIMKRPKISSKMESGSGSLSDARSRPIFQTMDYRSTLDIGWIPNHGVDFFTLFILDLHKKWRAILEKAELHLVSSVSAFLTSNS